MTEKLFKFTHITLGLNLQLVVRKDTLTYFSTQPFRTSDNSVNLFLNKNGLF